MLPFEEGSTEMRQGDRLFLYTDGILEYQNGEGELFGQNRLYGQISTLKHRSIEDHTNAIINGIMDFGDHVPPQDDVTLLGIERHMEEDD